MSFVPFLVIQVAVFAVLVVALRRILRRNVTDAAVHLQGLSAEYTRRQEELKQRLDELERQYQEQIARARTEAEQIIADARQEAEALRTKRMEEARLESERIVQQALESRDAMRKELEQEMDARAVGRACELIQQALPAELRRDVQRHWLEELFANGLAQSDRLKASAGIREVKVVSALPLTKEQRELLRALLKERLGRDIAIKEETDERLVAGVTVTIGSLVLDGTLATKIQRAIRHAHHAS
jgi:F0F1-type ATP synthase membrane subunit b/b'